MYHLLKNKRKLEKEGEWEKERALKPSPGYKPPADLILGNLCHNGSAMVFLGFLPKPEMGGGGGGGGGGGYIHILLSRKDF